MCENKKRAAMGYPKRTDEGMILDERCSCGGLRSQHEDTAAIGHGAMPDLGCVKFTWNGWVLA